MSNLKVGDKFYLGNSKCYFLDNICNPEDKSDSFIPDKILFTTCRSSLERYYFTGQCGFDNVYLRSINGIIKLKGNNPVLSNISNSRIDLGHYMHFKGGEYLVLGVAFDLDKKVESVIYESLCLNGKLFYRSKDNFLENVVKEEYNYSGPRFRLISKE